MTTQHPAVDFDLFAATTRAGSDASWAALRAERAAAWTECNGGFWVLSGYEEVSTRLP